VAYKDGIEAYGYGNTTVAYLTADRLASFAVQGQAAAALPGESSITIAAAPGNSREVRLDRSPATFIPALGENKGPLDRQTFAGRLGPADLDGVQLSGSEPSGQADTARSQENANDIPPGLPSVTPPPAGVLAGVLPADWQWLGEGIEQFVSRLDRLGQDGPPSLLLPHLVPWLVFVAAAPVTYELLRLRLKKPTYYPVI